MTEDALTGLRQEIDRIDDTIHDLLMRRTEVVERVREVKRNQAIKIRPAREAEIVARLVARHRGPFPKRELVRMWRELIVATLSFEGPFSVAVYEPEDELGYHDLARDQYGSFTPMTGYQSIRRVIESVRSREATVGILPVPTHGDPDPWWRHLVTANADVPRIIAKLPIAGPGNGRGGTREAFAICPVDQEPTGCDRSFIAVDVAEELSMPRLRSTLGEFGLPPNLTVMWHDPQMPDTWLFLAEILDFVAPDDRRLDRLFDGLGPAVNRVVSLGGYAEPLTAEQLKPVPAAGV